MNYRVLYTEQFHDAIDAQLRYFAEQSMAQSRVSGWLTDLFDLVDGLDRFPRRFPISEIETAVKGLELRKVAFGDYLIFYHIDDDLSTVQILGLRHGARLP